MLIDRLFNAIRFSSCLIATAFTATFLYAQSPGTLQPQPANEASWLLATCSGTTIPGSAQPGGPYALAECIHHNGKNKIITGYYYNDKGGSSRCRFNIDKCPGRTQHLTYAQIEEEFECQRGQKDGDYRANIVHRNHSQSFGMRVEATYANGKLAGESRHFSYSKKSMCFRYQYQNGLLDGKSEKFNGETIYKDAFFKNGLLLSYPFKNL